MNMMDMLLSIPTDILAETLDDNSQTRKAAELFNDGNLIEDMPTDLQGRATDFLLSAVKMFSFVKSKRFTELKDDVKRSIESADGEAKRDLQGGLAYLEQLETMAQTLNEKAKQNGLDGSAAAEPVRKMDIPLDKPNHLLWDALAMAARMDSDGQITTYFDTSKKGSKQNALVYYSLNWDEAVLKDVTVTRKLTYYDKRVYEAVDALYKCGHRVITATQIYLAMGNNGRPGKHDLERISDSVKKMHGAEVTLNNVAEVKTTKGNVSFDIKGSLLPYKEITAHFNGKKATGILLNEAPPLMEFARKRHQITTINISLLKSDNSKTERSMAIEDYLIWRIAQMRNETAKKATARAKGRASKDKYPKKILFTTVWEKCGVKTEKQIRRAKETARQYLDHYTKEGWISGYDTDEDGFLIAIKGGQ